MTEIKLTQVPKDIFGIIIRKQAEIKIQKGCRQFGVESTVYCIIREWNRCIEEKEKTK